MRRTSSLLEEIISPDRTCKGGGINSVKRHEIQTIFSSKANKIYNHNIGKK